MSIKEQLQKPGRGNHITGHDMTAPERYAPDTRHMVILDVRKDHAGIYGCVGESAPYETDQGVR